MCQKCANTEVEIVDVDDGTRKSSRRGRELSRWTKRASQSVFPIVVSLPAYSVDCNPSTSIPGVVVFQRNELLWKEPRVPEIINGKSLAPERNRRHSG